jgi:site-specific recombinase XerD
MEPTNTTLEPQNGLAEFSALLSLVPGFDPARPVGELIDELVERYSQSTSEQTSRELSPTNQVAQFGKSKQDRSASDTAETEKPEVKPRNKPYGPPAIYRRHSPKCDHEKEGRNYTECDCPLWVDGRVNGKRVHKSLETRDKVRARAKVELLNSPNPLICMPVAEGTARFMSFRETLHWASGTGDGYRSMFGFLQDYCDKNGIHSIDELSRDHYEAYLKGRKLGSNTVSVEIAHLHKFGEYCQEHNWCAESPVRKIKAPKYVTNSVEPYTAQEIKKMFDAAASLEDETSARPCAVAMIHTLRNTAIRISDLARLSREMFKKRGGQWYMRLRAKKNHELVFLPVPDSMMDALDKVPLPEGADASSPFYFWNGSSKLGALEDSLDATLRTVFDKAGVKDARTHRFRHNLATELLGQGATLEEVGDILGISAATVKRYYGKWSQERQERIARLLNKVQSDAARSIDTDE